MACLLPPSLVWSWVLYVCMYVYGGSLHIHTLFALLTISSSTSSIDSDDHVKEFALLLFILFAIAGPGPSTKLFYDVIQGMLMHMIKRDAVACPSSIIHIHLLMMLLRPGNHDAAQVLKATRNMVVKTICCDCWWPRGGDRYT
jgi:hypothetical protein